MITPAKAASPWLRLAWLLLVLLPPLWIAWLIFQYGVDLPDGDEWSAICPLFVKMQAGTLHLADFFAFHNEHRIVFPRLCCFGLGILTHWDTRAETFLTWCLAGACSFNLWQLSRATGWRNSAAGAGLFIVANALLFTPTQVETWLLPIEIAFIIPLVCVTACLWIPLKSRPAIAFPATMALSTISTFSLASGFLCWVLAFPLLFFRDGKPAWRGSRGWWAFWLAACATSILLYFRGYQPPASHPNEMSFASHPLAALEYLLAYLGGDFALVIGVAVLAGAILLCAFAASVAGLWKWRTDRELFARTAPWLLLCCFALANAAATTIGRLGFGVQQALSSRYILFSILLPIGLLFVIPPLLQKASSQPLAAKVRPVLLGALLSLAGGFALVHFLDSLDSIGQWAYTQHHRRIAKAAVAFINTVEERPMLGYFVSPEVAPLGSRANALDQLGYLRPPLLRSASIREIADPAAPPSAACGAFERCGKPEPGKWTIAGWAMLPEAGRPADAVLITYDDSQGSPTVFALTTAGIPRPDAAAATHNPAALRSGWTLTFDDHLLPAGAKALKIWSYDAERGRAWREKGETLLPR